MRYFFLMFLLFCLPVFDARSGEVRELMTDAYDNVIADMAMDLDEIIEKLRLTDPGFVRYLENSDLMGSQKLQLVRTYLAKQSYEYYKDKFLSDLKQRGKETGRKVKHRKGASGIFKEEIYWLDNGDLDKAKCHINGDINQEQICKYPDGFEEYYVILQTYIGSGLEERFVNLYKDMPSNDQTLFVDVMLRSWGAAGIWDSSEMYSGLLESTMDFEIVTHVSSFKEEHKHRNDVIEASITSLLNSQDVSKKDTRKILKNNLLPRSWKELIVPTAEVTSIDATVLTHHEFYKANE